MSTNYIGARWLAQARRYAEWASVSVVCTGSGFVLACGWMLRERGTRYIFHAYVSVKSGCMYTDSKTYTAVHTSNSKHRISFSIRLRLLPSTPLSSTSSRTKPNQNQPKPQPYLHRHRKSTILPTPSVSHVPSTQAHALHTKPPHASEPNLAQRSLGYSGKYQHPSIPPSNYVLYGMHGVCMSLHSALPLPISLANQ